METLKRLLLTLLRLCNSPFLFLLNHEQFSHICFLVFSPALTALQLAYPLCHRPHRTEHAPAARFVKEHHDKTDDRRCQHHAVEAIGKLDNPSKGFRQITLPICPMPWQLECPKQRDALSKPLFSCRDKPCHEKHIREHRHEKDKESITEPFGR